MAREDPPPLSDFLLDAKEFKQVQLMDYYHGMYRRLKSEMQQAQHPRDPLADNQRLLFSNVRERPIEYRSHAEQAAAEAAAVGASTVDLRVNTGVDVNAQLTINYLSLREISKSPKDHEPWAFAHLEDIFNVAEVCSKEFAAGDADALAERSKMPKSYVEAVDWHRWRKDPYNRSRLVFPVKPEHHLPAVGGSAAGSQRATPVIVRRVWCICLPALALTISGHRDFSQVLDVWKDLPLVRRPKTTTRGCVGAGAKARRKEESTKKRVSQPSASGLSQPLASGQKGGKGKVGNKGKGGKKGKSVK